MTLIMTLTINIMMTITMMIDITIFIIRLFTSTLDKSQVVATSMRFVWTNQANDHVHHCHHHYYRATNLDTNASTKPHNSIRSKSSKKNDEKHRKASQSNAQRGSYHVLLSHASGSSLLSWLIDYDHDDNKCLPVSQKTAALATDGRTSRQPGWQVWLPPAVYSGKECVINHQ